MAMALNRLCDSIFGLDPKILLLGILDGMDFVMLSCLSFLLLFRPAYFPTVASWHASLDNALLIYINLCEWELSHEV